MWPASVFAAGSYAFSPSALPPMVVSAAMVHIGFVTLRREGVTRISLAFLFVIAALATWLANIGMAFLAQRPEVAMFWTRIAFIGVCAIPAATIQFVLTFLRQTRRYRLLLASAWTVSLAYEAVLLAPGSAFFRGMRRYSWGYYSLFGPEATGLIVAILAAICISLVLYVREYRRHPPGSIHRLRALSFSRAFAIAYLANVDFLPNYGISVYPLGYIAILAFIIIANRTIRLYKLQDITPSYAADSILTAMQDALLVLDDQGAIRVANLAAGRLFDVPPRTMLGQPLHRYLKPAPPLHSGIQRVQRQDITLDTPTGRRWLQLSVTGIQPRPPQPPATIVLLHDITERKQAEKRLQEAHDLLEQRVAERTQELEHAHQRLRQTEKLRAVGILAASIAHEIGGPIFAIRNMLEGFRETASLEPDQRRLLAMGIDECERVGKLLQNLRDLHTPDSGRRQRVDCDRLLDDVLLLCSDQFEREEIRVARRQADEPLEILASADQIKQVLFNLFANARDAMPAGGRLEVSTARQGDMAKIVVADTGRGIDPEHIPHLFEPFFTTKEEQFGSGLGLYLSYNIVKSHGGILEVRSTPGRGSTFTVSLPLAPPP